MTYTVLIRRSAQKALEKIAQPFQDRIIQAIRNLSKNPRPAGAKKLAGRDALRIRVADYRIIYEVDDDRIIIEVVVIGHRRDVYQ